MKSKLDLPAGMREVKLTDAEKGHVGWGRLDWFIKDAAMTSRPDCEFNDGNFALFLGGDSIVGRFDYLSLEDQNRLNTYAAVIYRGPGQRPVYFMDRNKGIDEWNSLCVEMHHGEAQFEDEDMPPAKSEIQPEYLN